MGFEIDFLAVGEESAGGDAIALRWGNLHGSRSEQTIVVIDGGYSDNGSQLVELIRTHYGTNVVDIVVSTHPDQDHIKGLETVLEEMEVHQLLMHQPWKHSHVVEEARLQNFSTLSFNEKLVRSLQEVSELEQIATRKGIQIDEPFAGMQTNDGCFRVLGPSENFYESLLPEMSSPPSTAQRLANALRSLGTAVANLVKETLHEESLTDSGDTRPSNNSSVIALLQVDGKKILFTGDAGVPALEHAMDVMESEGFTPGDFNVVQIPHHGSRRNVGPTILNRMLGDNVHEKAHSVAYVSAPKKNPEHKHPSKKVTNAFTRRGYAVHATQGRNKRHHHNAPVREGYSACQPLPFYDEVEEESAS